MAEGEHFYRLLAFHLRPEWQEAATLGTSRERAAGAEALRQEVRVGCVRVDGGDTGRAWSARKRWFYFTSNREQLLEGSKEGCDKI